jgi:L-ascorbate metabolism protein UlaG (beta-lactamase superfamily)
MKIQWLAHAAFLITSDNLRVITDPFEPNDLNLPPITEPADIVIRSSPDDIAHAHVDTIPSGFELVTATEIVDAPVTVKGVRFDAIWSQESLIHKDVARDNAMYRFTLEGVNITHMGDVGNALTDAQLAALAGTDILLALAGGPPVIEHPDLHRVIEALQPKVVIPMHYRIPGPKFFMQPVTDFTSHYDAAQIVQAGNIVEFSKDSLPDAMQIVVMEPTLVNHAG